MRISLILSYVRSLVVKSWQIDDETSERPSITQGLQVAHLVWPEFREVDGMVFLKNVPDDLDDSLRRFGDATGAESSLNHIHVLDNFVHLAERDGSEGGLWWNSKHPDFQAACNLGKLVAQSWLAKLRLDFPQYDFRVYYTEEDNPIIRFHRVREGERPWLDEKDWLEHVQEGKVIVLDTRRSKSL